MLGLSRVPLEEHLWKPLRYICLKKKHWKRKKTKAKHKMSLLKSSSGNMKINIMFLKTNFHSSAWKLKHIKDENYQIRCKRVPGKIVLYLKNLWTVDNSVGNGTAEPEKSFSGSRISRLQNYKDYMIWSLHFMRAVNFIFFFFFFTYGLIFFGGGKKEERGKNMCPKAGQKAGEGGALNPQP